MNGIKFGNHLFNTEELMNTPGRVERYLKTLEVQRDFLGSGKFTVFDNPGYDQMIILKDIDFMSFCSHHLLPFVGKAHVAYIPQDKICGLSKLARVVDAFAARPQIQERMTQEIADFLEEKMSPQGVMVVVEAQHFCMKFRGVMKPNSVMVTSAIKGVFKQPEAREEFLRLIK